MEHSEKKEIDFQLANRETADCWPSGTVRMELCRGSKS